jgi:hypothetical protein
MSRKMKTNDDNVEKEQVKNSVLLRLPKFIG